MIIPQYWSEASTWAELGNKKVRIRRFGWSDESVADAERHANLRVAEAATNWLANQNSVKNRERKIAYNGPDGLPIREEVIESSEGFVITRNGYGALCLNCPNVLIADVDYSEFDTSTIGCMLVIFMMVGVMVALLFQKLLLIAVVVLLCLFVASACGIYSKLHTRRQESVCLERLHRFVDEHKDWGLRVYKTPAGLRAIATHSTLLPQSDETKLFFDRAKVDPLYRSMCLRQECFRARLTAKPWRCGISDPMLPRKVWPIGPADVPIRAAWVARYNARIVNYAACKFLEAIGQPEVHPEVRSIIEYHDRLSQALSDLPIA